MGRPEDREAATRLTSRYPELHRWLACYLFGDFTLEEEIADLAEDLEPPALQRFLADIEVAVTEDAASLDAFVDDATNWDLGGGRVTLLAIAERVKALHEA